MNTYIIEYISDSKVHSKMAFSRKLKRDFVSCFCLFVFTSRTTQTKLRVHCYKRTTVKLNRNVAI